MFFLCNPLMNFVEIGKQSYGKEILKNNLLNLPFIIGWKMRSMRSLHLLYFSKKEHSK